MDMRFTVTNVSVLPAPWIYFEDHSDMPGYRGSALFNLRSGDFKQWSIEVPCDRRGLYTFGGSEVEITDPFGFFKIRIGEPTRSTLLVLPRLVNIPQAIIRPDGLNGEGRPHPNMPEQSASVSSVRDYREGDSTRYIHWPTSVRREKLSVRSMEGAPESNWLIVLDLDERCMAGEGWNSIEEQAVALAATFAELGLRQNIPVGLISNGRELVWLTPAKGEGQRWEILLALSAARPGWTSLDKVLKQSVSLTSKHTNLLIITASHQSDWVERIYSLRRKSVSPRVFLFHGISFGGLNSCLSIAELLKMGDIPITMIERGLLTPIENLNSHGDWGWYRTRTGQVIPMQGIGSGAKRSHVGSMV